jgi:ABC-2 type transport system ATP-binding protein
VLLSSHILAEVQAVCGSATIIGNGRLLASGRVEDLLGDRTSYRVAAAEADAARRTLEGAGFVVAPAVTGDTDSALTVESDDPAAITRVLAGADIWVTELTPLRPDLETVFLQLTAADTLGHEHVDTDETRAGK